MHSTVKLEMDHPSDLNGNRSRLAGMLMIVALLATLFFGIVGKDKLVLISPLILAGYVILAGWMAVILFSRKATSVAPAGFSLFLLFSAYGVALIPGSGIPYEARFRMLEVGLYVGAYYLWSNSFTLFRRSRAVLGWVMLFALLACFYGLVNHFKNPDMVLWLKRYSVYEGRLASTYICPNHFAHLLQMLLPFCLVLILIPRAGWLLRLLAVYCIAVFLPTMYFTESRAGMLGSVAALGVTVCLLALRKSRKLFVLGVVLVPLLSTMLLVGAWNYSEMFKRRMAPVVDFIVDVKEQGISNTKTQDFRPLTWLDTVEMIKEKPLTGFGPGSYRYLFPEYRQRFMLSQVVTGHPHNEYLEVASEYGLIGLVLLSAAWSYALLRLLWFSLKTPSQHHAFLAMAFIGTAAGTLLHSFFDFQMYIFQNALLFALLASVAVGPLCRRRQEALMKQGREGFHGKFIAPAGRIFLAVLVFTGLFNAIRVFPSAFVGSAAGRMAEAGNMKAAEGYYALAIKLDSSNWRACKGMGSICFKDRYYTLEPEEKRRLAEREKDFFAQGYQHNPKDPALVFDYGMATLFLGDTDAGLRLLEEAARLRPFNDIYWLRLGIEQRKAERYDQAMETFTYAKSVRNSKVARKNIEWLRNRKAASDPVEPALRRERKPLTIDTDIVPAEKGASLTELLELMEEK